MSAVEVETYRNKSLPVENNPYVGHQWMLEALGLTAQAALSVPPRPDDAALIYGELVGEELEVWDEFLPNGYSRLDGDWATYDFDVIPAEVTEELLDATRVGLFHDIEIWTPIDDTDPMAVGVIYAGFPLDETKARYFPIVRWGESLLSYDEAREVVLQRRRDAAAADEAARKEARMENISNGLFLGFVIVVSILTIALWGHIVIEHLTQPAPF